MRFAKFNGCYGRCAHALRIQISRGCARKMHADFTKMRRHNACRFHACCEIHCFVFQGNVHTQFACRFLLDAHARCMQISRRCAGIMHADFTRCGNALAFKGNVRTHVACRFRTDAHANPMSALGARSMRLEACNACTKSPELEARSLQPEA